MVALVCPPSWRSTGAQCFLWFYDSFWVEPNAQGTRRLSELRPSGHVRAPLEASKRPRFTAANRGSILDGLTDIVFPGCNVSGKRILVARIVADAAVVMVRLLYKVPAGSPLQAVPAGIGIRGLYLGHLPSNACTAFPIIPASSSFPRIC